MTTVNYAATSATTRSTAEKRSITPAFALASLVTVIALVVGLVTTSVTSLGVAAIGAAVAYALHDVDTTYEKALDGENL